MLVRGQVLEVNTEEGRNITYKIANRFSERVTKSGT
jgi:hypothetical protein